MPTSPPIAIRLSLIGLVILACLFLAGCGGSAADVAAGGGGSGGGGGGGSGGGGSGAQQSGTPISGLVNSGLRPVSGAAIQLYAAGTDGYASSASSLFTNHVTSGSDGTFIGYYNCPSASTQIYIVATGGNPGLSQGTDNAALALMTGLGSCGSLTSSSYVTIDEVTTIATVWALSPFLGVGGGKNLGSSPSNKQGLANAFATILNLVNFANAAIPGPNLPTGATIPVNEMNTLAGILAPCVNSTGTTGECSSLFSAATPSGGDPPTNTIDATWDIAQNPGNNVVALYALLSNTPPFQPVLSAPPTDWTLAVDYTGGVLENPVDLAIDSSGDVWVIEEADVPTGEGALSELANNGAQVSPQYGYVGGGLQVPWSIAIDSSENVWVLSFAGSLSEFSDDGTALSPSGGYAGSGLSNGSGIALDNFGDVWATSEVPWAVAEFSDTGTPLSPPNGITGGGLSVPLGIAVDTRGNVWVSDNNSPGALSEFSSDRTAISPSTGYVGGGLDMPSRIAVDSLGNVWVANQTVGNGGSVSEFSSNGDAISSSTGYTGGGLSGCVGIAIDGLDRVWTTNSSGNSISELSSSGTPLSPSTGYTASLDNPWPIVIDSSGNVWVAEVRGTRLIEFVGVAAPVVTPIMTALKNNQLGQRP